MSNRVKSIFERPFPPCGAKGSERQRKDGKPRKSNKYPAKCDWCERDLMPGEGAIELSRGVWKVYCFNDLDRHDTSGFERDTQWGGWDKEPSKK